MFKKEKAKKEREMGNPAEICPFRNKPMCKFPCRICKRCWKTRGCMSCINSKARNTDICDQ